MSLLQYMMIQVLIIFVFFPFERRKISSNVIVLWLSRIYRKGEGLRRGLRAGSIDKFKITMYDGIMRMIIIDQMENKVAINFGQFQWSLY